MIERTCRNCGKTFLTYRAWLRGNGGLYCSRRCASMCQERKSCRVSLICATCGSIFFVQGYRKDTAKFCSIQCLADHRGKQMAGKSHPNWKGGITNRSWLSKKWSRDVKKRDNYRCSECGKSENLNSHHIEEWAKNTELRFSTDNGVTLCVDCHCNKHTNLKFIKAYGRKMDSENAHEKRCASLNVKCA